VGKESNVGIKLQYFYKKGRGWNAYLFIDGLLVGEFINVSIFDVYDLACAFRK